MTLYSALLRCSQQRALIYDFMEVLCVGLAYIHVDRWISVTC